MPGRKHDDLRPFGERALELDLTSADAASYGVHPWQDSTTARSDASRHGPAGMLRIPPLTARFPFAHYRAHEEVLMLDRSTQTLKKEELADEVQFEVDAFLGELVKHIDPEQDEKTLIFCAIDEHADMVVWLMKEALRARYDSVDDDPAVGTGGFLINADRFVKSITDEYHDLSVANPPPLLVFLLPQSGREDLLNPVRSPRSGRSTGSTEAARMIRALLGKSRGERI